MARDFTAPQRALLRSADIKVRLLSTWWLDDATYRFCDDVEDLTDGTYTWIGASALFSATDIRSGANMAAEPVTLTVDGTRLHQSGFTDPAGLFREVVGYLKPNRRVDLAVGAMYPDQQQVQLVLENYAGKINNAKIVDPKVELNDLTSSSAQRPMPTLTVTLDSLALRYQWSTGRTRSHNDQLEIDPADMFYSFVSDSIRNEGILYWGKKAPVESRVTKYLPGPFGIQIPR
jgi:hypothetical protein